MHELMRRVPTGVIRNAERMDNREALCGTTLMLENISRYKILAYDNPADKEKVLPLQEELLFQHYQGGHTVEDLATDQKFTSTLKGKKLELFKMAVREFKQEKKPLISLISAMELPLVISVAKKYLGSGMNIDDLTQIGFFGVRKAVEKYDPNRINPKTGKRYMFSTYAVWWVRQSIQREIDKHRDSVHTPTHVLEQGAAAEKIFSEMRSNGDDLTIEDFTKILQNRLKNGTVKSRPGRISIKKAQMIACQVIIGDSNNVVYLSGQVNSNGETWEDIIEDKESISVEEKAIQLANSEIVRQALRDSDLTDRERLVIELHYGLADGQVRRMEEIVDVFGLSRERIRQIERRALGKLFRNQKISKLKADNEITG